MIDVLWVLLASWSSMLVVVVLLVGSINVVGAVVRCGGA